jgi:eukaryotic-like serine/threonine-protein kinase
VSTQHVHTPGDVLLERYKIIKYLDEGGMQQVYLAKDVTFGRKVALKVPKTASAEKRFERSARVSAKVVHANVAATLDYFDVRGKNYLIEEFIEGQTLWDRLENEFQIFDPHLAARIFHHLAKGVAASHHAGVFHRDLKPSNIMVSRDPGLTIVKITDFGIAKMAEEEIADAFKDKESTTGSQTVMGALPYMAPEMIVDQASAKLPADVWALGALLYQLISGKLPFGKGLGAVPAILATKLPSAPALFSAKPQFRPLTDSIWSIVTACLQKDPAIRPTADQLVEMCSKLCYSNSPRSVGSISNFGGRGRGRWGFIDVDGGGSAFFHWDSFYGDTITVGGRVNFADFPGVPKDRAFPILPMK